MKGGGLQPQRRLFYFVTLLIPILFFAAVEFSLWIFNYGHDYTMWVSPAKGELLLKGHDVTGWVKPIREVLILNPDIAHKYFRNTQDIPTPDGDVFEKVKGPNTFRVFVLGGSAAAGFPFLPNGSFSGYLRQRLSLEYPHSKIEVVNCGLSAVNSYTLRDFMPGILEEKPDLIIIYAGNNEYVGPLGVGSVESLGTSRDLVNLVIYLEQFRTFQFLRNVVNGLTGLFEKKHIPTGTLMSRMARKQYVPLDSKAYREGIAQFDGNMTDLLEMAKKRNVPVILGTLTCNLKDQYPFVSVNEKGFPRADSVFMQARRELAGSNYHTADSLFRYARDLDALRFRPPGAINRAILRLGRVFNCPVVNVDSIFDAISPDHIAGDNFMTDHLHPSLRGYEIIGRLYYHKMEKENFLPRTRALGLSDRQQDSITVANLPFCDLDSVMGAYRVKVLKDDWPFVTESKMIPVHRLLDPKNHIDSLAYRVVVDRAGWATAHKEASLWYYSRGDLGAFVRVMRVLVKQYPYTMVNYDFAIAELLKAKDYDGAYYFLIRRNQLRASAFTEKWTGVIDLVQGRIDSAESHLTASLKFNDRDPQIWYYLTEAYVHKRQYRRALKSVESALELQPNFPEALTLRAQVQEAIGRR